MLLCLWAFGLCVGLLSGLCLPVDAISPLGGAVGGTVVALAVAWLCRRRHLVIAGLVAAVGLGTFLGRRAATPRAWPAAVQAAIDAGHESTVEGRCVRTLRFPDANTPGRRLIAVDRIDGVDVSATVALTVAPSAGEAQPGDAVRFRTRLTLPMGLRNPGMPDPAWTARAQGIDLVGWLPASGPLSVVRSGVWWGPRRLAEQAHRALGRAIVAVVPSARSPLLVALVLGERAAAGADVEAGFKAAGAVHALSVSGLHLTAVAGALFLILRQLIGWLPILARRVRPAVLAAGGAIPALAFYCAVAGEATATRRAALMAILGLTAVLLDRMPSLSAAIGASAIVLLVDAPLLLLDPSFQLSFASVGAVALAGRSWQPVRDPRRWRRAGVWLGRGLLVSTAAFIATAPLAAHHFAELAPASPIGNLLLVPPVELGIVPLGLLGATLGALWAPLGHVPLLAADWLCRLVLWVAATFRVAAPVLAVPSPDGFETTAWLIAAFLVLLMWGGPARDRRLLIAGVLATAIGAIHIGVRAWCRSFRDDVRITFLDVGQGDAALIEGPGSFVALIDGGGNLPGQGGAEVFDPGARVIEPVLRRKLIGRLDLVVLSHPHPDHMNGLFRVIERFDVGAFWSAGDGAGNPEYDRLVALVRQRGVVVETPRRLARGAMAIEPLGPYVGEAIAAPSGLEANDASLVLRLTFAGRRVLFTGDIEAQGEAELLGRHQPEALVADVLKVPHHGSRTSSGEALISAVHPAQAVMSLGRHNRFGFPRAEVLERYRQHQVEIRRTDWNGAIEIELTGGGLLLATCARSCR
jgi:competence protein ComEC